MLKEVSPTEDVLANQVAQRLVQQVAGLTQQIVSIRANGVPAVPAVEAAPAQLLADGRTIPARPARQAIPAISPEAIDKALGADNCMLFDSLKVAIVGATE
jgi:hypothetical protein